VLDGHALSERCPRRLRVATTQQAVALDPRGGAARSLRGLQRNEGWVLARTHYDDGGSGGTLERPALQRLLADIRAGRIDIVVVYKVDRLTREPLRSCSSSQPGRLRPAPAAILRINEHEVARDVNNRNCCTSTAQRATLTTLANSTSRRSPVVLGIRPCCSPIFRSKSSRRSALRRSGVPFSSTPSAGIARHVGGEDRRKTAGLAHVSSPAARRRPDRNSSRALGSRSGLVDGTSTGVRDPIRLIIDRASLMRPICA